MKPNASPRGVPKALWIAGPALAEKATNTEVLSIELPRDTKGWGGHGNYIVLGGNDVSDVRHAISLALELTNKYAGEVYISESGHLEFAFTASSIAVIWPAAPVRELKSPRQWYWVPTFISLSRESSTPEITSP